MTALQDIPLYDWINTHFSKAIPASGGQQPDPGQEPHKPTAGDQEDNSLVSEWLSELSYDEPVSLNDPVYDVNDPVEELFDDWVAANTAPSVHAITADLQGPGSSTPVADGANMVSGLSLPDTSSQVEFTPGTSQALSADLLDDD